MKLVMRNQMLLCKTIATAISFINREGLRKKIVNDRMSIIDLQTEYVKYQERREIIDEITAMFKGSDNEEIILQIVDVIIASEGPKVLYLNSLKAFGREKGVDVYRKIKNGSIGRCV